MITAAAFNVLFPLSHRVANEYLILLVGFGVTF
jgi:hypothetical protein